MTLVKCKGGNRQKIMTWLQIKNKMAPLHVKPDLIRPGPHSQYYDITKLH